MHVMRWAIVALMVLAATLQPSAQQQTTAHVPASRRLVARNVRPRSTVPRRCRDHSRNALNSTNRDARFGRIADSQVTDKSGLFTFKALDPGSYIVEMMGNDHSILAASQVLDINAGEAVSAVVKLPFRIPPFAGILGNTTPTTASAVTAEAAASSVLAVTNVGEPTCP